MIRIVDVSGYSFSGKSALVQLLHEFERAVGDDVEVEFDFLRAPGGMLDFYSSTAGSEQWSPIRASDAVNKMYRLIHAMGGGRSLTDRVRRGGPSYDFFYPGFTENARHFMRSLIEFHYRAEWPYTNFGREPLIASFVKFARHFGLLRTEKVFFLRPSKEEFFKASHAFFLSLVEGRCNSNQILITNNAFEPYAPRAALSIVGCGVSLIVDRDPRDIYLSAKSAGRINGVDVGKATIGGSVEVFVRRFMAQRSRLDGGEDIIRFFFEDLVDSYEQVVAELTQRMPLGEHVRRGERFNPSSSKQNVRAWKNISNRQLLADVNYIEQKLPEYLRESDP